MHQAVSTGWLVAGMFYTQLGLTQTHATEQLPEADWQTPAQLVYVLEELEQQAQLPAPPTAFSIDVWPDIYAYQAPAADETPLASLELDSGLIQPHPAPAEFTPYRSPTNFFEHNLDSTRELLADKDMWPTYVVPEEQKNWMDSTREYLHSSATGPVVWFDNFFAVNRSPNAATHDLRLTPILECSDLEGCQFKFKVRSRVTLPNTEKRMRLLLTNEDPNSLYDTLDRRATASGSRTDDNPITAALSWALKTTDSYNISISSGLQVRSPLRAFVQASSTGRTELSERLLLSAGQSVFYRSDEGLGARTQIDLDYSPRDNEQEVVRWRQLYDLSEEFSGVDWKTSVEYLRQVNRDRAWGVGYGNSGNINEAAIGEAHKVWVRYRKRFYREWLFWELEPFVQWKRDFDFQADPGIEASIEIYLDNDS
ncbi:hypothetical protein QWY82_05160 [Simiduia curdlanivorans]|uniref:Uncharacterized protein n=1 Tax=Simiduia curdlanivorans TaxID=1492769 RepID=A0ABV8V617_9GAMM|nr:hypothetical protein [Simiduia curdlanivorans]MDN3638198.1 hypothetical protein [Simiduia curdlanivorans]